jgi:hypothetical protein
MCDTVPHTACETALSLVLQRAVTDRLNFKQNPVIDDKTFVLLSSTTKSLNRKFGGEGMGNAFTSDNPHPASDVAGTAFRLKSLNLPPHE